MAGDALYQPDGYTDMEAARREEWEKLKSASASLVQELEKEASDRVAKRNTLEQRWLRDLRQYHGIYEKDVEATLNADNERSKIFINITRPKTTSWEARLSDLLFPNDDKNWGINPTPVPELVENARMAAKEAEELQLQAMQLVEQNNQMVEQGVPEEQRMPVLAQAHMAAKGVAQRRAVDAEVRTRMDEAKRRTQAMSREIDDQLTESRYPARARDVIQDSVKLGVGILKGPFTSSKQRRRWVVLPGTNVYILDSATDPRPDFRRVDPWSFFPDPNASTMEDCEDTFERHMLNKRQFRRMAKALNFHADTVRQILRDGPMPMTGGDFSWLTELRNLDGEQQSSNILTRFLIWEYHGALEVEQVAMMMRGLGRFQEADEYEDNADPLEERMVIIYFCQGQLLKISEDFPLDSGDSLYSVFTFERAEASIMGGVGVPWLMRHEQSMLNSAVRMMMDNGALSIGPQIVIDKTQVEPENGSWKMTPRKVWKKSGGDLGVNNEPFRTYNIPMNQAQIAGIIELAIRFTDEVVSMPTISEGEQGAHVTQTASGMSMLFNSANVVFRRVVKNWDDDLTTPTIRRAYDWNMQFNTKDEIKGDMQTEARGTSVLLVREVQSQQLLSIATAWSTHPVMGPAIKVYETMRMTLQAMSINPDDVLKTPEDFEQAMKQMAEAGAGEESPDVIRAKASIEVANITATIKREEMASQGEIAKLNQQTEILKLIQKDGVDMAQVQALLAGKSIDVDSKERMFAAEAAIERENADRAAAQGVEPTGSGGFISAGTVAA